MTTTVDVCPTCGTPYEVIHILDRPIGGVGEPVVVEAWVDACLCWVDEDDEYRRMVDV